MRLEVQVITQYNPLNIRKDPTTSSSVRGTLPKGSTIVVNDSATTDGGTWYRLENGEGWIAAQYSKVINNLEPAVAPAPAPAAEVPTDANSTQLSPGLDRTIIDMLYKSSEQDAKKIDGSTRLFGAPFQFTSTSDFRINSAMDVGRKYLECIVSEAPIVYFIPGRPNYLPDLSESEKKSMTSFFTSSSAGSEVEDCTDILSKITGNTDIRYFDFIPDYPEYMKYANLLCRLCAVYLGIGDRTYNGTSTKYKFYDWSNYKFKNTFKPKNMSSKKFFDVKDIATDMYETMFGVGNYVQFYVEPNTSFSESESNNTTTSKLEGMFQTAEGIIKELSFLTNTAAVKSVDGMKDSFAKGMDEISQKMLKNSKENFFSRLLGMSSTVLTGSNIIFPELWGDSAYNKSYNVSISLKTPYGDKESIYLNLLVPLMHILALSLPRQSTANSYSSPFLVKVFSKGWFSCELGIIDSISIDKGGEQGWNGDGLPLEIKVQLGVKDLYTNLMITSSSKPELFFQNQGLIDFLAVTCGLDVTKPNFITKLESIFAVLFGKMIDLPGNFFNQWINDLRTRVSPIFKL